MDFYIVDVFAEDKYAGNQLAVVFGEGVISLSDAEMQQIAQEMNYSETSFIPSSQTEDGGYDVRIFTPQKELPFAGHPTLGTAYIIQQEIIQKPLEQVILNLGVGQIPVTWTQDEDGDEIFWMRQNNPEFYHTLEANLVAEVLGLEVSEIDPKFPIQEVSTGIPFILVPLKNLAALKKAKVNLEKYSKLMEITHSTEILIFSPEPYSPENQISARMFAPSLGIPEDPATGSANGCLAGYLIQHSYFEKDQIDLKVEQGYEINRPSILYLKAKKVSDKIEVMVGGKVVKVAKGELL
ncbi:PhzF family phenazine biosynthesis protein [Limnoraphis robusta]|uniref:PhzF family phenazine biosynthesis protein n=1 Tax=Limnoraphis robusta CCNP1315 TaxID=3110306 RepID=A0ABU5U4T3_9CYAN|nr:PhzF family phenazine biosynthesis protein [Limnoraphis robusta]MEA5497985.1 PhzF family phenazine biosynthesis protein [Limnoraphis robusta BA-68 BA1]MEA5522181.1 PhzF family phenazine biosynthesis protein [Limnoraphis robusta CCNP1315]MEA5549215.1 PhzF family phenazine biosynthesis protein [Limnoraphis robusta CCNP1324]